TLTTTASSIVRVQGIGGTGSLTVLNGFTNNGTIELSNVSPFTYGAALGVTNGTLVNAAGANLNALPGQSGGPRTLAAQLVNQGTLTVTQSLTLDKASAAHSNSGTITLSGGDLTINQSGTNPSFTNNGSIAVASSRTLTVNSGTWTQNSPGTLSGAGAVAI